MGAVGWKTRVSLEKMKTFCIKSAGVNLDCMLRADTIKYKWLCTFIRAGTLSALMRLRKLTFSCSKIKGILKAPRPYRLLLSTKKKHSYPAFLNENTSMWMEMQSNLPEATTQKANISTVGAYGRWSLTRIASQPEFLQRSVSDMSTFWERIYCM